MTKNKTNAQLSLMTDLNNSCLRYLEIRIAWYRTAMSGQSIEDVDQERTKAHNALIANFNAVLRLQNDKPTDMVKASVNRVEIGIWGMRRAVALLDGSKSVSDV